MTQQRMCESTGRAAGESSAKRQETEGRIPREHPILFSAPMVQAILAGRKTQTRRPVKDNWIGLVNECMRVNGKWVFSTVEFDLTTPCGEPGDRLWVRETWANTRGMGFDKDVYYRADTAPGSEADATRKKFGVKWKPSIHMPRWASRITLEITDIQVQRFQDFTEEDAIAEGVETRPAENGFFDLWGSLYGCGKDEGPFSIDNNPWVWVITFKRIGK